MPDARLIVVLRNPVDRAFSCYTHLRREGFETLEFEEALELEDFRISQNWAHLWHYKSGGYYYQQLLPYFKEFGKDKVKVYLFDDLCNQPESMLKDIFDYLGVDNSFKPDMAKQNVSGLPKIMLLQKLVSRDNPIRNLAKFMLPISLRKNTAKRIREWNLEKIALDDNIRKFLMFEFKEDILQLQNLIQRDLSAWLP